MKTSHLMWFRRDLRLIDNATLAAAAANGAAVHACFVFDRAILDPLSDRADRRVSFIRDSLAELQQAWRGEHPASGIRVIFLHGDPSELIPALAERLGVAAVFAGRDFEPAAKARDAAVAGRLALQGQRLELIKDQVVFTSEEVRTRDGGPFSVFTPYRRRWRERLRPTDLAPRESTAFRRAASPPIAGELSGAAEGAPPLALIGFAAADLGPVRPGHRGALATWQCFAEQIDDYDRQRDFPAIEGTSRLSVHLRFGTISIRALATQALQRELATSSSGARGWLDELIWREFYMSILDLHPHVVTGCWRREYDALAWDDAPELFAAWCAGRTGYPFVDAAMRQLVATGDMPNRARMVVASFLSKDLGIDWRLGERFFARHLLDYDLAANNGGWQWAASTGCDAQPYFRIFNPLTQARKFDPDGRYIRRWVPELHNVPLRHLHAPAGHPAAGDYPLPVIDHATARQRTLQRFAAARASFRAGNAATAD